VPSGVGVFWTVFSPQYAEHGCALRNPVEGGADGLASCFTRAIESSRPMTAWTLPRLLGTWSDESFERRVCPCTV
jgi:hypothetical protein